ncbi:MAG: 3-deoxy-manno-octulosonate cytidylyltransferase [Elusimicrobiota bacterium]
MKIICVIPARYGSTRFPGKPLANICGRPMLWWVWEKAKKAGVFERVIIATDDKRIFSAAKGLGAEVMLTSAGCKSGTDRVAEVSQKIKPDIVVNLQGDEPLIAPSTILKTTQAIIQAQDAVVSTPVCYISQKRHKEVSNLDTAKVVFDKNHYALYFSRLSIPATGDNGEKRSLGFYKHIGLYAYRADFLKDFVKMKQSSLEKREKLEQLRILENGYKIKIVEVKQDTIPVDRPSDIRKVERALK